VVNISANPTTSNEKFRLLVDPSVYVDPAHQQCVLSVLDAIHHAAKKFHVADRGHKHSSGVSEVTFHITHTSKVAGASLDLPDIDSNDPLPRDSASTSILLPTAVQSALEHDAVPVPCAASVHSASPADGDEDDSPNSLDPNDILILTTGKDPRATSSGIMVLEIKRFLDKGRAEEEIEVVVRAMKACYPNESQLSITLSSIEQFYLELLELRYA
jgi:hypothetical protein